MLDHNPFLHFFDKNDIHIPLYEDVTVIEMGNTMQISHMSFHNPKPATKKLAGGKYENLRTGEIFESRKRLQRSERKVLYPLSVPFKRSDGLFRQMLGILKRSGGLPSPTRRI